MSIFILVAKLSMESANKNIDHNCFKMKNQDYHIYLYHLYI